MNNEKWLREQLAKRDTVTDQIIHEEGAEIRKQLADATRKGRKIQTFVRKNKRRRRK